MRHMRTGIGRLDCRRYMRTGLYEIYEGEVYEDCIIWVFEDWEIRGLCCIRYMRTGLYEDTADHPASHVNPDIFLGEPCTPWQYP